MIRSFAILVALQLLVFPLAALAGAEPTSSCDSYLLADLATGDILFGNKPNERIYPASTTKIMTAMLLLENVKDLSEKVTVGDEIDSLPSDASVMHLIKGEKISLKDLLYGLMLPSGGDAAVTIAVRVGGSIEGFVAMMNTKAAQLGMTGTHFSNPDGLHDDNHYSTAADLVKLTIAAMANPTFQTVVATPSYTTSITNKAPKGHEFNNTNKLVKDDKKYHYEYAIGVKTGYTDNARSCLVSAAKKGDQTYIAVVMGDASADQNARFTDSVKFFNYGFTQKRIDLFAKIKATPLSYVFPGDKEASKLTAIVKTTSIVKWMDAAVVDQLSSDTSALDVAYNIQVPASPKPTGSNTVIGTVTFSYQGNLLYSCDVVKTPVEKPGLSADAETLIKLVSIILIGLAILMFIVLILRKITRTRNQQKRRYQTSYDRTSRRTRLKDPHDYR